MKKGLIIMALVTLSAVVLTGCKTTEEKQMDAVMDQLSAMNDIVDQEMEIQDQLANGEITEEEANEMSASINSAYEEAANKIVEVNTSFSGMPGWAKTLGLSEAKGLKLNNGTAHGDDYSISLDYTGDYEVAAAEARRIGIAAGLKEDTSMKSAVESVMKMGGDTMPEEDRLEMERQMKAIMFSSATDGTAKNIIVITVNPDGDLAIAASSEKAIERATR